MDSSLCLCFPVCDVRNDKPKDCKRQEKPTNLFRFVGFSFLLQVNFSIQVYRAVSLSIVLMK